MRKYYINNKAVTIYEWKEEFAKRGDADVILRTHQPPEKFKPPEFDEPPISPEKVRSLKKLFEEKAVYLKPKENANNKSIYAPSVAEQMLPYGDQREEIFDSGGESL